MMKSLYSGVAGMKVHNQRMDVIGNNVSNVNTIGYKASTVNFKDIYYQTKSYSTSGSQTQGGKNPKQIGYGAQLGTITQVMTQSGFTYTDNVYDCALEGDGYFQVMDNSGNIFYTRSGAFTIDSFGNLTDQNGFVVLGVMGDPSNTDEGSSQRITLNIPRVEDNKASAEKTVNGYGVTITANDFGDEGNITFRIIDSDTPFATRSGNSVTVYMDLSQDFGLGIYQRGIEGLQYSDPLVDENGVVIEVDADTANSADYIEALNQAFQASIEEFQGALYDAMLQGGLGFETDILPLDIDIDTIPPLDEVLAKRATNNMYFTIPSEDPEEEDQIVGLTFTATVPGSEANKYEIDLKTDSRVSQPSAKWKGDVLTITLPGAPYTGDDSLIEAINSAIAREANGEQSKIITVDYARIDNNGQGIDSEDVLGADDFSFDTVLEYGTVDRVTLDNGRDNFFSDMAVALSTVALQNGRYAGDQFVDDLELVQIDSDGVIYGTHAVHGLLALGRIDIATFENPMGLEQIGTSLWRASVASGPASVKIAGQNGAGSVVSNAREMSNVDLAQEFSDMIITQRGYQANSRIITVSDTMLEELVNLKR